MNNENEMRAAEALFQLVVKAEGTGTAIVAAGCVAGVQLLRGTGIPLDDIPAGQTVLVDFLNDQGIALLNYLDAAVTALEGTPIGDWNLPELVGTGPEQSLLELTMLYEKPFVEICEANQIEPARRPTAAMLALALLIHRASPVMDAETGKAIAAQAIVFACKTAPGPLPV